MRETNGAGTGVTVRGGCAVLAAAALSLTAGCGGGTPPPAPGRGPVTATVTVPAPAAAALTDRGACADADCEVDLEAGDTVRFDRGDGAGRFTVTAVDGADASWELPGARRCGASGPGNIRVRGDDGGCVGTVGAGTTLSAEGVTVTFVGIGASTVRVRLTPSP
ncbi:hypothetical protein ACIQ7D_03240 [Streptomyces sp. NPDC096310]|uniref:hypothetical protein n=1 Tax=Streptomyces sp. NPDC096310 TaxID=3366082 RepID=UPI0037F749E7